MSISLVISYKIVQNLCNCRQDFFAKIPSNKRFPNQWTFFVWIDLTEKICVAWQWISRFSIGKKTFVKLSTLSRRMESSIIEKCLYCGKIHEALVMDFFPSSLLLFPNSRPKRFRRMPKYLDDFVVEIGKEKKTKIWRSLELFCHACLLLFYIFHFWIYCC